MPLLVIGTVQLPAGHEDVSDAHAAPVFVDKSTAHRDVSCGRWIVHCVEDTPSERLRRCPDHLRPVHADLGRVCEVERLTEHLAAVVEEDLHRVVDVDRAAHAVGGGVAVGIKAIDHPHLDPLMPLGFAQREAPVLRALGHFLSLSQLLVRLIFKVDNFCLCVTRAAGALHVRFGCVELGVTDDELAIGYVDTLLKSRRCYQDARATALKVVEHGGTHRASHRPHAGDGSGADAL
mmetsp:Transcript_36249/g.95567  ORF Transcript_36249/g.95567 Transcript_36249/m.95567 type:complete len:235 (+) Transcript_36249:254-958(+)